MRKLTACLVMVLLALVLTACDAETPAPTATQAPAAATVTTAPTNTTAPSPTVANTPTDAPVADACVECHTDKDQLIDTAKPEEVVVEESEGAG